MRRFTLSDKLVYLVSLIQGPWYIIQLVLNGIKSGNNKVAALQPANNRTACAASQAFKVSEIKAACRDLGCSVNDLLTTVFTTSLSKAI